VEREKTDTSEMFSSVEEANEWLDAIIEHSFRMTPSTFVHKRKRYAK